ncbi:PQQ-dependent sugar dehydrogenase [Xylophilus sp. GOD-11R]|uniref:PQQ-dependent sugar dehydrogenase n=1 Tax=Xylophilus sp. GOD-11R TaxID=3089814 RepID=UPI00298CB56D|nr:PQQ-dependent sugar dehydrogenase [Xylophilus sp. GOD-11R]WPB56090.1 PQQ-dependent sugar dehydrogenase [Xylophilus sp. GOD-11R]
MRRAEPRRRKNRLIPTTAGRRAIAPAGLAFYTGTMFPEWRGQLFSGSLAGQALWRLTLSGNTVAAREAMYADRGERFRDVRQAPDGALPLLTDSGKLMRLAR